jgi:MFS family permease
VTADDEPGVPTPAADDGLGREEHEGHDPDAGPAGAPPLREPLTRNIYVVSSVSFLQDTASEMLYPVLPLFLTVVLGAQPAVLGAIEGIAEGTAAGMKTVSGRLADVRRRRPLIGAGYGISAFGKAILALATGWPLVLLARFVDRLGKGLRGPPRDALIAGEVTAATRGRAFGFHRMADTAGAVVGPLLGLAVYQALGGTNENLRTLFAIAVVPAVLSALLVLLIRERPHGGEGRPRPPWRPRELPQRYWRLLTVLGLFSLVNFPDAMLLLRATDLGYGFTGVVLVYVLYNLTYAGLSYPAGALSDRLSRRVVFAVGLVVFSATYTGFGLAEEPMWLWLLLPLYGCYTALTDGVSRAWVADLVPADETGTALGLYAAVSGFGLFLAGLWAGLAWGGTGHVPFLVSGVVVAVLAVVLLAGGRYFDGAADAVPAAATGTGEVVR